MFFRLLLVCISLVGADKEGVLLQKALKSRKLMTGLYSSYVQTFHKHYKGNEAKTRLRIFASTVKTIDNCNNNEHFHCKLNQFSTMTKKEQSNYLGLGNSTRTPKNALSQSAAAPLDKRQLTSGSYSWLDHNGVSDVKNQGSCGSCWAYAAAASIEGAYAAKTGIKKSFSDQELLECTYEEQYGYDGCGGGWYYDAFDRVVKKGHLSTSEDLRYEGTDGACRDYYKDGLLAAKISGYVKVEKGDWGLATAIRVTPTAIAMMVQGDFYSYSDGTYDGYYDCQGSTFPNHAMTAVGFTTYAWIIKNSWGFEWGKGGYIEVSRSGNQCFIHDHAYYPELELTGDNDYSDNDYDGGDNHDDGSHDGGCDGDNNHSDDGAAGECQPIQEDCLDLNTGDCPGIKSDGYCLQDWMIEYSSLYCRRSCGFCNNNPVRDLGHDCIQRVSDNTCGDDLTALACPLSCCKKSGGGGDGCPSGTIMCSDGLCKHEHMCHYK